MKIRPFRIAIPQRQIAELHARLDLVRLPRSLDPERWEDGASLAFMTRLVHHWRHRFDWREQETRLNRMPQFMADVDGLDIHFVHQKGSGSAAFPIVLTHGWPGSFIEMERILSLLTDPAAHGGDPADAFDVVVPSLPGFGFSGAPASPRSGSRRIAELWLKLMTGLGYPTFGAQGGDIGAGVSAWLARLYPQAVAGIHLNYIPGGFRPPQGPVTPEEAAYLVEASEWIAEEGAYAALHSTKPLTLSYALRDSPVGLAAWMAEKIRTWSDCDGDIERVMTLDELLSNVSLYWFSEDVGAPLRLYKENRAQPLGFQPGERVLPPLGLALFPRELPTPPRSWVERVFDVQRWTPMPKGGHFAALEQPELLAQDIRAFFRPMRAP